MDKRFRFCYGETHDKCHFADDEKRVWINSPFQLVDLLNDYYNRYCIVEEKLRELGFRILFVYKEYDMDKKKFKLKYSENSNGEDKKDGNYIIVSDNDVDKYLK